MSASANWWDELPASGSSAGYSSATTYARPSRAAVSRSGFGYDPYAPVRTAPVRSGVQQASAPARAAKKGGAMGTVLGLVGMLCLSAGGYVVYSAKVSYDASVEAAEAPMPMPATDFSLDAAQALAAAKQQEGAQQAVDQDDPGSAQDTQFSAGSSGSSRTGGSSPLDATAPHRGEIALIDHTGREVTGAPAEFCRTPKSWLPNRIYIPSMCVSAPVLTASAPNGSMQLPENPAKLAWLSTTAAVDATQGTSVLSGHVNMWGKKGALYDLALMRPGTKIHVTDGYSQPHTFVVSSLKAYRKKDLPESVFDTGGPRQLALVTCGGKLIHGARGSHYEDNVVAVAVPLQSPTPSQQPVSVPGAVT